MTPGAALAVIILFLLVAYDMIVLQRDRNK